MADYRIPFNKPLLLGKEFDYMRDAVERGHISGDGYYSRKCQELLEKVLGVKKVLMTTSCTHALEMCALLLDIKDGDEVILPSYTFVSTVNAFVLRGAIPVFCEIREDTLNIDENLIESLITEKTKAIVVVHYAGVGCEMDKIMAISQKYNIPVVEDNAHGLFGKYKGKYLGTFGALATQSFHETKNFTCGEGGALIINDEKFIPRAEIIREKGTNRSRFFRGEVDRYTWVDIGSSYVISDLLCAYLYAQLENYELVQNRRKEIWNNYYENLKEWAEEKRVRLPIIPHWCEQAYHMFYLLFPSLELRQKFIGFLKSYGILSVFHYVPLHLSEKGLTYHNTINKAKSITEDISNRIVRLPFYYQLTQNELMEIISTIKKFNC